MRIGIVRAALEVAVTGLGFVLGGTVGIGTLAFAFGIGPAVELSFKALERAHLADPGCSRIGRAMKGLVCAGGEATRLGELTRVANKHLLPVGSWPMIYYPLQLLQRARRARGARRHRQGPRRADDRPARRRAGSPRAARSEPLLELDLTYKVQTEAGRHRAGRGHGA